MLSTPTRSDNVPPEMVPFLEFLEALPGFNATLACQAIGFNDAAHHCHPTAPVGCNDLKSLINGTLSLWAAAPRSRTLLLDLRPVSLAAMTFALLLALVHSVLTSLVL